MRIPKKYGDKLTTDCVFCKERQATTKTKEGIPVCEKHRHEVMPSLKCVCGCEVELTSGKYGPYGICITCGNVSLKKLLAFNSF